MPKNSLIPSDRESMLQFARYLIVGALNTLVTLLVIFVTKSLLGINPWISNLLGYVAGIVNSFFFNRGFVFRSSGDVKRQAVAFAVGCGLCYLIQLGVTWSLAELTPLKGLLVPTPWMTLSGYGIATLVGMCAYTLSNFIYNRVVAFR